MTYVCEIRGVILRRDRQLIAEAHRRVLHVALGLQAPIVTLYTGSVLQGGRPGGWTFAVVPGGVHSVVARPIAGNRPRTSRTAVPIGRIIVRPRRYVKIIGNPLSALGGGRGNRVWLQIRAR